MGRERLLRLLRSDQKAADVCLSFFVAATNSYKVDTVLRPFPPGFLTENGEKDFDGLKKMCQSLPDVRTICLSETGVLNNHQVALIEWVLDSLPFTMHTVQNKAEVLSEIQHVTSSSTLDHPPSEIMALTYNETASQKFSKRRADRNILYGFHGTRVFNLYSIVKNGFIAYMNKTSLYGEGTYLTEEPSIALNFSPTGPGWQQSIVGRSMTVCTFCEIIEDSGVKGQSKVPGAGGQMMRHAPNSEGGAVPEKYFVVTDNELVRVKYLLIYAQDPITSTRTQLRERAPPRESWIWRHRFWMVMIFYAVLLVSISLFNSKKFWGHMRRFCQTAFKSVNVFAEASREH